MWNWIKQKAGWIKLLIETKSNETSMNITRPLKIAEILNDYFIEKIEKIRSTFTKVPRNSHSRGMNTYHGDL